MPTLSSPALRAAVAAAVLTDPDFLAALRSDAPSAIEARFGRQRCVVHVVHEQVHEMTLLIHEPTEVVAPAVADCGGVDAPRPLTRGRFEALISERAWRDPIFLDRLQRDPRATLDEELAQHGARIPDDMTPCVYREAPGHCIIVIPAPVVEAGADELSDVERAAIRRGELSMIAAQTEITGAVAGVVSSTAAGE
jgi:hypothetical protein